MKASIDAPVIAWLLLALGCNSILGNEHGYLVQLDASLDGAGSSAGGVGGDAGRSGGGSAGVSGSAGTAADGSGGAGGNPLGSGGGGTSGGGAGMAGLDASGGGANDGGFVDASGDRGQGGAMDAGPDVAPEAGCGLTMCQGSCVNTQSNDGNCGACDYACVHGRHCVGGRCTPAWLNVTDVGAPTPRVAQGAVVNGKLVVTGGYAACSGSLANGGTYDPDADAWATLPNLNQSRAQHTVASAGSRVYAFGGLSNCAAGNTPVGSLEEWKPGDTSWTIVAASSAPSARYAHTSVWTGSKLLVYGGSDGVLPYVSSGRLYDPTQNAWSDASCAMGSCERVGALAIVDQGYVRLWGGGGGNAPAGIQYQLAGGAWSPWSVPSALTPPSSYVVDDGRRVFFPAGVPNVGCSMNLNVQIYDKQTLRMSVDTSASPAGLSPAGSMGWTGSGWVVWSGPCGASMSSVGGRYQPPAP